MLNTTLKKTNMKTEKKNNSNAGRKPVSDKKKPITIYVRESTIEKLGIDKIKEILNNSIL